MTARPAKLSLGLGLADECDLAGSLCYRDPHRTDRLTPAQVEAVMERLPIRSVNLGTGENGMHPEFKRMLGHLRTRDVKLTITSNGHSIRVLDDEDVRSFAEVKLFPRPPRPARSRTPGVAGARGSWCRSRRRAAGTSASASR